ncbi:uncharacterized protein LY89DRAFT_720347 [Mollisia scopiformis]|uniref:Uncharacterized protein n=1 Tax=Mollisia scopiformis TaxID=149040 RepID=A0A194X3Y7_MOLSC|nr:uncharacterized protein LY89DRAFT_720347 [Mollisia scopiformis]KUJ14908.1 hypothetical protein LY89DRAFT_720347 [Mollisia scopiformis]
MMRIIGKMFSSSQAQPVKDETESDQLDQDKDESASQLDSTYSRREELNGEPHNQDDQDILPEVKGSTINSIREKKDKVEAKGKVKRGKAGGKSKAKNAPAQKSQVQEELLQELGEEPEDLGVEGLGKLDGPATVNGIRKEERKSKGKSTEHATGIRRSTRKQTPAPEDSESDFAPAKRRSSRNTTPAAETALSEVGRESNSGAPLSRQTRSGSALNTSESAAEEQISKVIPPKTKQPRKINGTKPTNRKKKGAPLPEIVEDLVEDNDVSMEDLIKQSRLSKSATATAAKKQSKPRGKKVIKSPLTVEDTQEDVISGELENLPEKIENAKPEPKTSTATRRFLDELAGDDDDPAAALHQPLTSALARGNISHAGKENLDIDAQIQSDAWSSVPHAAMASLAPDEEEENANTPKRPSKKALGKRKASDAVPNPRKRQRKGKNENAGTPPLTNFGFTNKLDVVEAEESNEAAPHGTDEDEEGSGAVAGRLVQEPLKDDTTGEPESQASQTTPSGRRPTPAFTPINRTKTLPPSKTPVMTPSRVQVVIPARKSPKVTPASHPNHDSASDSGSEFEPDVPEVHISSEKRKRRLPTDEPTSSKLPPRTPKSGRAPRQVPKRSAMSKTPKSESTGRPAAFATANRRFNDEEMAELAQHVGSWREENEMTQHTLNDKIQAGIKDDAKHLVDYICDQMPSIPRVKIITTLRRNYHNWESRGKWTKEQDEELKRLYEVHKSDPAKWRKIGAMMNKYNEDVRDRWRDYVVCGDKMKEGAWGKDEEERLKTLVQEVLEDTRERKQASLNPRKRANANQPSIDWLVISEKMGYTRSRLQCQQKWSALKDRQSTVIADPVATAPISETEWRVGEASKDARAMSADKKLRLLYAIRDSGAGQEGKIPWVLIQRDDFYTKGERMALKVCFRRLRQQVPNQENMQLQAVVEFLIEAFETAAPNEPNGFDIKNGAEPKSVKKGEKRDRDESGEPSITKKRKSTPRKFNDRNGIFLEDEPEDVADNGEGTSTGRLSIAKAKKPGLMQDSLPRKKTKLHERMRQTGQSESQESGPSRLHQRESSDDILSTMQSMKTGKPKAKRVAKKPLTPARTTQAKVITNPLSTERVTESDDAASVDHTTQPEENLEQKSRPEPESDAENLEQNQGDDSDHAKPALVAMDIDVDAEEDNDQSPELQPEDNYPDLGEALDENGELDIVASSVEDDAPLVEDGADESESDEEEDGPPVGYDDTEDQYTLPALPRPSTQSSPSESSDSGDSEDSEDERDLTTLTHDKASVDLDNTQDPIDEDEPENLDGSLQPENEPRVNGIHSDHHDRETSDPQPPPDVPEQRGFEPGTQGLRSSWDGYGDALQYNRDLSRDSQVASVPGRNVAAATYSISSPASTIPRFVISSAARNASNEQSEQETDSAQSDSEVEEEDEEPIVEHYAEDDIDEDYQEVQQHRRKSRSSARQESLEL